MREVGRTKELAPPSALNPVRAGGLPDQVMRPSAYRKKAYVPDELITTTHWNVFPYKTTFYNQIIWFGICESTFYRMVLHAVTCSTGVR